MTDEQLLSLCKPGITLADFKPITLEMTDKLKRELEESRRRQKESLKRKDAPFINYLITI